MHRRSAWAVVTALLVLHGALAWRGRMPAVLTGEDEATYLLLAKEVRHLRYRNVYLTDQSVHTMYPPGYPAMLALWGAAGGDRFDTLLMLGIVSSATALLLAFVTVGRLWSEPLAFLVLAPLAVNPSLVRQAGTLASEAPYTMLTLLALWSVTRRDRAGVALAGTAALLAALTRSVGITVVVALAVHWLWARKRTLIARWGPLAVLAVGVWFAWSIAAGATQAGPSYAADFLQRNLTGSSFLGLLMAVGKRVVTNVPQYLGLDIPYMIPLPTVEGTPVDNAAAAALACAGLVIGFKVLWRHWRAAALYLLVTAVVLAIWPWALGRFVVPLLPLLVLALLLGVGRIVGRRWPRWTPLAMAGLAAVLFVTGTSRVVADLSATAPCPRGVSPPARSCLTPDQASFFEALAYVQHELPAGAVLLTTKRATAFYYTGRREVEWRAAVAAGPDRLMEYLRDQGVSHVLLGALLWADLNQLPDVLAPNCAALQLVEAFPPRTYLLRVREPDELDDGSGCRALAEHRASVLRLMESTR